MSRSLLNRAKPIQFCDFLIVSTDKTMHVFGSVIFN